MRKLVYLCVCKDSLMKEKQETKSPKEHRSVPNQSLSRQITISLRFYGYLVYVGNGHLVIWGQLSIPAAFPLYIFCIPSPLAEVAAWETGDPDTVPVPLSNGWYVSSTDLVTNPRHCTLEAVGRQLTTSPFVLEEASRKNTGLV